MAFNYTRARATADRLIRNFGRKQGIRFGKKTSGSGPAHKPGPPSIVWSVAQGVVLPFSPKSDNRDEADTLVDDKMRTVLLSPLINATTTLPEPEAEDLVEFDSKRWKVLASTPISPAGIVVLHKMTVRWVGGATS